MSKVLVKLFGKLAGVGRAHNKDKKLHPTDLYCRVVCLLYTKNDRSKQGHKNAKGQSMVPYILFARRVALLFAIAQKVTKNAMIFQVQLIRTPHTLHRNLRLRKHFLSGYI